MGERLGFEQFISSESGGEVKELEHVLEDTAQEENYTPDRQLQVSILRELPDNLVEELHGHLISNDIEQRKFAEGRGREFKEDDEGRVIRGELFERLAAAQYGRSGAEVQDPRFAEALSDA